MFQFAAPDLYLQKSELHVSHQTYSIPMHIPVILCPWLVAESSCELGGPERSSHRPVRTHPTRSAKTTANCTSRLQESVQPYARGWSLSPAVKWVVLSAAATDLCVRIQLEVQKLPQNCTSRLQESAQRRYD